MASQSKAKTEATAKAPPRRGARRRGAARNRGKLVIVESPTKARTIERTLGADFLVLSSMGHVRDLPQDELGVEIERGFEPHLIVTNRKQLAQLRKAVKAAQAVYLATDNDREGEAIAFDLYETLRTKTKTKTEETPYWRVVFNEITPAVIRQAIEHPTQIDLRKVEAQRARRILDRLVGYLISPLLSKSLSGSKFEGLSAGRVQSVALRFICDRELEIQAFVPEEYWQLAARLALADGEGEFVAALHAIQGKKPQIKTEREAKAIEAKLQDLEFVVCALTQTEQKRTPPPPFITSTLQQAASSALNFPPKKTMRLAQELYEGVELEEGREGLITYMRTDSLRVSDEALQEARAHIRARFGEEYLSPKVRVFKNKRRSQDAHEAIRPTRVARTPEGVERFLKADQLKLYRLIWQRAVATQMAEARYRRTKVVIRAGAFEFRVSASRCLFPGFLKVLPLPPLQDENVSLPPLEEGQTLRLLGVESEQRFTEPPKRYSEAGLIKALEEKGIGRPSTYAQIVSTIQERGYVVKEKGSLRPTLLGLVTTDFLKDYFPITVQTDFTAQMEEELDQIAEGARSRVEVLGEFYKPLSERLEAVQAAIKAGVLGFRVLTDVSCRACGAPMEVRFWKGSRYLGCSNYPTCKDTVDFPEGVAFEYVPKRVKVKEKLHSRREAPPLEDHPCPACGAPMQLKQGPYGRFFGCSRYPQCKTTEPVISPVPCPSCGGQLVERYSRKRRQVFYGCRQFPACRFTVNREPVEACPACESGVLVADSSDSDSDSDSDTDTLTLVCTNRSCGHRERRSHPDQS